MPQGPFIKISITLLDLKKIGVNSFLFIRLKFEKKKIIKNIIFQLFFGYLSFTKNTINDYENTLQKLFWQKNIN